MLPTVLRLAASSGEGGFERRGGESELGQIVRVIAKSIGLGRDETERGRRRAVWSGDRHREAMRVAVHDGVEGEMPIRDGLPGLPCELFG